MKKCRSSKPSMRRSCKAATATTTMMSSAATAKTTNNNAGAGTTTMSLVVVGIVFCSAASSSFRIVAPALASSSFAFPPAELPPRMGGNAVGTFRFRPPSPSSSASLRISRRLWTTVVPPRRSGGRRSTY